jgi:hypothetical protein
MNRRMDLPGVKEGLWDGEGGKYKEIDPDHAPPASIYKMMISVSRPHRMGWVAATDGRFVGHCEEFGLLTSGKRGY